MDRIPSTQVAHALLERLGAEDVSNPGAGFRETERDPRAGLVVHEPQRSQR